MAYLGIIRGRLLSKPNNRTLYLSLNTATFVLGRKGQEKQLNKGRIPTKGD